MDQMVNNIRLVWKLACMFKTYRTYNLTVEFSKYKFINKLLGGVTLLKVTPGVTWIQLIYIYIYYIIVLCGEEPLFLNEWPLKEINMFRVYSMKNIGQWLSKYIYIYRTMCVWQLSFNHIIWPIKNSNLLHKTSTHPLQTDFTYRLGRLIISSLLKIELQCVIFFFLNNNSCTYICFLLR